MQLNFLATSLVHLTLTFGLGNFATSPPTLIGNIIYLTHFRDSLRGYILTTCIFSDFILTGYLSSRFQENITKFYTLMWEEFVLLVLVKLLRQSNNVCVDIFQQLSCLKNSFKTNLRNIYFSTLHVAVPSKSFSLSLTMRQTSHLSEFIQLRSPTYLDVVNVEMD